MGSVWFVAMSAQAISPPATSSPLVNTWDGMEPTAAQLSSFRGIGGVVRAADWARLLGSFTEPTIPRGALIRIIGGDTAPALGDVGNIPAHLIEAALAGPVPIEGADRATVLANGGHARLLGGARQPHVRTSPCQPVRAVMERLLLLPASMRVPSRCLPQVKPRARRPRNLR